MPNSSDGEAIDSPHGDTAGGSTRGGPLGPTNTAASNKPYPIACPATKNNPVTKEIRVRDWKSPVSSALRNKYALNKFCEMAADSNKPVAIIASKVGSGHRFQNTTATIMPSMYASSAGDCTANQFTIILMKLSINFLSIRVLRGLEPFARRSFSHNRRRLNHCPQSFLIRRKRQAHP